jgi:hypothetical protein
MESKDYTVSRDEMVAGLKDYCKEKSYNIVPEFFFEEPEYSGSLVGIVSLLNASYKVADDYNK